jgi:diaminopimelate epimerase
MDARGQTLDFSKLALRLCKQFGTDGFMAMDTSDIADIRLHFYTPDGARGEMCGNGARCICRFAYELGIVGGTMSVQTDAGIVYGQRLSADQYRIRLNAPSVIDLTRQGSTAYIELGNPGVPHAVLHMPALSWDQREDLREMAKALRYSPAFPKGANVNLYEWLDDSTVRILTYERGVEDYTLACGTGSASVAVVLWLEGRVKDRLTVENLGGTLVITVSGKNGTVEELWLEGPTEVVKNCVI